MQCVGFLLWLVVGVFVGCMYWMSKVGDRNVSRNSSEPEP